MKVLGHRVLITPDAQSDQSESGLILPENRDFVATSGTVIQVGTGGPLARYEARQRALGEASEAVRAELERLHGTAFEAGLRRAVNLVTEMLGTIDLVQDVRVGDRVAFDADHGVAMTVDGEPYVILQQDDVVIIVDEAEEAA